MSNNERGACAHPRREKGVYRDPMDMDPDEIQGNLFAPEPLQNGNLDHDGGNNIIKKVFYQRILLIKSAL